MRVLARSTAAAHDRVQRPHAAAAAARSTERQGDTPAVCTFSGLRPTGVGLGVAAALEEGVCVLCMEVVATLPGERLLLRGELLLQQVVTGGGSRPHFHFGTTINQTKGHLRTESVVKGLP